MKKGLKAAVSILLCLALVFQLGGWAFAAQISGTISKGSTVTVDGDDVYYYTALGDSVAAGFMVDDSIEPDKAYNSMYVEQNAKNSPVDSYPSLLAGKYYEARMEAMNAEIAEYNAQLKLTKEEDPTNTDEYKSLMTYPKYFDKNRQTIQDVLFEQGMIEDKDAQFDYSNMGMSAFMACDYVRCLLDPTFVSNTYKMLFESYYQADMDRLAEIGSEAFKAEMLQRIKTEFEGAADSWDVVSDQYSTYAYDSETESYVVVPCDGKTYLMSTYSGLDFMTYQSVYPAIPITMDYMTGDYNITAEQFTDWFNGNDSITYSVLNWTDWTTTEVTVSFAEWFDAYYQYYEDAITCKAYQYHDILWEELSKADLITINVGANDLLEKLMLYMGSEEFLGFDPNNIYTNSDLMGIMSSTGSFDAQTLMSLDIDLAETLGMKNPINFAIYMVFSSFCAQSMDIEEAIAIGAAILFLCRNSITVDNIVESLRFFAGDGMKELIAENAESAMEYYRILIEMIHYGGTFSYLDDKGNEHTKTISAINPNAQLVFVGTFNPYGNSYVYNGVSYDQESVIDRLSSEILGAVMNALMSSGVTLDIEGLGNISGLSGLTDLSSLQNLDISSIIALLGSAGTLLTAVGNNLDLEGLLADVIEELRYPLIYNMIGMSGEASCRYLDASVKELAETKYAHLNIPFVEIYDKVSNEADGNPHPLAKGHYEIYQEIMKALVSDVYSGSNENSGYEIGDSVLWNSDLVGKLTSDEAQEVYVNGKKIEVKGDTFTIPNVMDDLYIYVCTGEDAEKYAINFTDGTNSDIYYAFPNFPLILPELPESFKAPEGMTFGGWNINGVIYQPGDACDDFTKSMNVIPVWVDANGDMMKSYTVTISGSNAELSGNGSYYAGQTVKIDAGAAKNANLEFDCWVSDDVTIQNASSASASFVMPEKNITLTATWKEASAKRNPGFHNFKKTGTYKGYVDVNEDYWYGANQTGYIKDATLLGIVNGDPENTFRPEENITIGEVIKIAAVIHSIYSDDDEAFTPIAGAYWYVPYVNYAVAEGIIKYSDFKNYNANASRYEVAYIFGNALPAETYEKISTLVPTDVAANHPYRAQILRLFESGICNGYADASFKGNNPIIRAEICAMITRIAIPSTRIAK